MGHTADRPHVLIIPFPAQGHVIPMMALSHSLIKHGIKITFVNTEFNHARVLDALSKVGHDHGQIDLVAIPDGMAIGEDRKDLGRLCECMPRIMPACLEELIGKINSSGDDKITYVIADESVAWSLEVAEKMGLRRAAFFPAAAALLATLIHIPKLIEAGTIGANGFPPKEEIIRLSPTMPAMSTSHLAWLCVGDPATQHTIFKYGIKAIQSLKLAHFIVCNSFDAIEQPTFELAPRILPIGPLLDGRSDGNFWPEDSTCLSWLDQQPKSSVIYVAFGSFTVLNPTQFQELAHGLELSNRPFLWVVRPDLTDGSTAPYPDGFLSRVANKGHVVGWAPQKSVLAHPSVACFITHCGWNSTLERLVNGIPFLCWPYFADQILNQTYISDVWRVGLRLEPDGSGLISRAEIKKKVEDLLGDEGLRARAQDIKEMAMKNASEGGTSFKNFSEFVEEIKGSAMGHVI